MVVMNLTADNILGFTDFAINFSYPKKIVNSTIENEHLWERPSFRYKKAVILMGANATGKTSLGKVLSRIFSFLESGNSALLHDLVAQDEIGSFQMDFVNTGFMLHRVRGTIDNATETITTDYSNTEIGERDTYEKCAARLTDMTPLAIEPKQLKKKFGRLNCRFAYPEIEPSLRLSGMKNEVLLKTLRAVIGTLDPTLADVSLSKDLRNSFILRRKGTEIIIQDGKLLNREVLYSGTAGGVDIAIFLAAIISSSNGFYYCDEHFSYIQTNIEKRIFAIMLDHLSANEQLIFTTHSTDMLDLNLPNHSFAFLRRSAADTRQISVLYASDILKRNTDSIRCAAENDVFSSLPDDSLLDTLEKGWDNAE